MAIEFKEAVASLAARKEVTTPLASAQWREVPLALRQRAFFSARVTNAQLLQGIKKRVATMLKPVTKLREDGTPFTDGIDLATARLEIKQLLDSMDYDAGEAKGTLHDLRSDARINLQLNQNVSAAHGHGNWLQGQEDGALDAFPAQELFRQEIRKEPRDWPTRWNGARGELGEATTALDARIAMIALKGDPIWETISEFDVPWPPFDFNSGMWVRDVSRERAEDLGLLQPGEEVQSGLERFNDQLKGSVKDLDPEMINVLKDTFGPQITLKDGKAWWKNDRPGKALVAPPKPKKPKRLPGEFPGELTELEDVKALGGSTGAKLVRDKVTGDQYVWKQGNSAAHLREEFTADSIYRAAGVDVPEAKLFDGDRPTKIARFVEGEQLGKWLSKASAADQANVLKQVRKNFVADALLGNWDVAGMNVDNMLVDKAGKVWRIDNGGSLRFRAQGAKKTAQEWGKIVTEIDTLRDAKKNAQTARLFADITDDEIARQIDDIAESRGVILEAAPEDLREVLGARIDNLVQRNQAAANPFSATTAKAVQKSRINGKSLPTDKGDIEDNEVLWWEETGTDGNPVLRASLKLSNDASDRLYDSFRDQVPGGDVLFDEDGVYNRIVKGAKTVNHHLADGAYNASSLAGLKEAKKLVDSAIARKVITADSAKQYLTWIDEIEVAAASKKKAPMVKRLGIKLIQSDASPGSIDVRKTSLEYTSKDITNGHAKAGAQQIFSTPGYEINQGGAKVLFKPFTPGDHAHYTLQGRVELELPGGSTVENIKKASNALGSLGVNMTPASPDYQKAVYLFKGLNLRRDVVPTERLTKAKKIIADEQLSDARKVTELEQLARQSNLDFKAGAKDAIGDENGFGEGYRAWWRWDLTRAEIEAQMKGYALTHNSSRKVDEMLDTWLYQGGVATPVAERMRKGISISGGMSPSSDINNGTSDYLFTRISKGDTGAEWRFKIGNLARMDALSMSADWLAGHHQIDKPGVRKSTAKTVPEFKQNAGRGSNETLFKHGFNLLDELDEIVVKSAAEKQRVLKVFARHKITHMNDGREVAQVVRTR